MKLPPVQDVLVAYSGGKDSLAVLDGCVRAGRRVEAFFMYFIPGMDYTAYWVDFAKRRWGVHVHTVQHWATALLLRDGVFRPRESNIPDVKIRDVECLVRERSGIEWIGYGLKSQDSLERRGMMNSWPDGICEKRKVFCPLKDWSHRDVRNYLHVRNLPIPTIDGKNSGGVGLTPAAMLYLRNNWPADYKRVLKVFPYAAAQADRAEKTKG